MPEAIKLGTSILAAAQADRSKPQRTPLPDDTQEVCIDLPGEEVRCYVHKRKLQITLRKHRDVVFDIKMFKGMKYTVEADESDFYCPRDKKIVLAKQSPKQSVSFSDGEPLHLHVGRSFKGSLVVKANGKVIGRYQPNALDARHYGTDPAEKPEPLLVVMHNPSERTAPSLAPLSASLSATVCTRSNPLGLTESVTSVDGLLTQQDWNDPLQSLMSTQNEDQVMHVVEVIDEKTAPPAVLKFFMDGGSSIELDPNGVVTQNWILSQLFGAQAYLLDNRVWAKELMGTRFTLQRVKHKSKITTYIVFKGYAGLRKLMNASRYAVTNTKIVKMTAGAGSASQTLSAAKGAAKDSIKVFARENGKAVFKGGGVAVLFTIAMDTAEWYKDYSDIGPDGKPKRDLIDLMAKIGIDVVKAGLSAAIASVVVATILTGLVGVASVAALPALGVTAVVVGTIIVAIAVGYGLDYLDKKLGAALGVDDTTGYVASKLKGLAHKLEQKFEREQTFKGYEKMFEPNGHNFGLGGA